MRLAAAGARLYIHIIILHTHMLCMPRHSRTVIRRIRGATASGKMYAAAGHCTRILCRYSDCCTGSRCFVFVYL